MSKQLRDALSVLKLLKQVKTTGKADSYYKWKVLLAEGLIKKASDKSKKPFLLTSKGKKLLADGVKFYKTLGVTI